MGRKSGFNVKEHTHLDFQRAYVLTMVCDIEFVGGVLLKVLAWVTALQ